METILKCVANIDSSYSWLPTYRNSKPNLGLYTCISIANFNLHTCTQNKANVNLQIHRPSLTLLGTHIPKSKCTSYTHRLKTEPQFTKAQIQHVSLVHTHTNAYPFCSVCVLYACWQW